MTFSLHQAESIASEYAVKKQIQLAERLGFGMDGAVWKSTGKAALRTATRRLSKGRPEIPEKMDWGRE
jgi:hypothetical protein